MKTLIVTRIKDNKKFKLLPYMFCHKMEYFLVSLNTGHIYKDLKNIRDFNNRFIGYKRKKENR